MTKIGPREEQLRQMREDRARRNRPLSQAQVQKAVDRAVSRTKGEKAPQRGGLATKGRR